MSECNHAWETVQQCFECGDIRPFEETVDLLHEPERACPVQEPNAQAEAMRIMRELATCETAGKDVQSQRLIRDARKACGWTPAEVLR